MCPLQLASSRKPLYIHPPVTQAWVLRFSKTRRFDALHRATARMAKLVDAWDLKSPVRKDVPVRFRLRAPNKSRACMRFFMQALCFCSVKSQIVAGVNRAHLRALQADTQSRERPARCRVGFDCSSGRLNACR